MRSIALTREQSRELDRCAVEEYGIASLVLMENAGRGCVDVMERLGIDGPVAILCGKGNNAGDGFVMARHLTIRGYDCRVLLLAPAMDPAGELRGDAAANYALLKRQVEITCFPQPDNLPFESFPHLPGQLDFHTDGCTWLVDALLGTGAKGDPRPPYADAIDWLNARPESRRVSAIDWLTARPKSRRVLAVDVPSGLDCDTGQPSKHTVRADHTCTFAAMKTGFLQPAAKPYLGTVHVCDIGVPPQQIQELINVNRRL